ncbi:hypothetical protein AB0K20_31175 [Micromonospora matsumotoense]
MQRFPRTGRGLALLGDTLDRVLAAGHLPPEGGVTWLSTPS